MDTKAAFEKWLTDGLDQNGLTAFMLIQKRENGSYQLDRVNGKWEAWKASRAAIKIELPGQENYDDPLSAHLAIKDCAKAITSHGIRIKDRI